jgi:hypothetical protein
MKKWIVAGILAFALLAVARPALAGDCWGGGCGGCGSKFGISITVCGKQLGCGGACLTCWSPWYTMWPYESYFQAPAPIGQYPYWPPSMAPVDAGSSTCGGGSYTGFGVQQTGYGGQGPCYWYGN